MTRGNGFSRWMDAIANAVGRASAYHPWKSLLATLVVVAIAVPGLRRLAPDPTHRAYFRANDPLRIQVEEMERRFSNDDSVVLIVHSPSGIFDPDTADRLVKLTAGMWRVPDIVRVESLSNYRWVHSAGDDIVVEPLIPDAGPYSAELLAARRDVALKHEIIPGFLLSEDAKTTVVIGYVRPDRDNKTAPPNPIVDGVRELIAQNAGGDNEFHISGRTAVMASFLESTEHDMQALMPILLGIIIVLLLLVFRRLTALFALVLVLLTVVVTMGASGWLGMTISNITALVPQFIIAIGIAYGIHNLKGYFSYLRRGREPREAMHQAIVDHFMPTVMTAVTTSVGFLSFGTSDMVAIGQLGVMVGVGTLLAAVLTYTFLAPVVLVLTRRRKHALAAAAPAPKTDAASAKPLLDGHIALVSRYRVAIVALFVVIAGVSVSLASGIRINANPFKYFAKGFWLRDSNDFAERHLNGAQGMEVVVETGRTDGIKNPAFLRRVEAFQKWIDAQPGVVKTISVVDILKQTNRSLHGDDPAHYRLPETSDAISQQLFMYGLNLPQGLDISNRVTMPNDALRISVKWTLYDSSIATAAATHIEEHGKEMGLKVGTTGKVLMFQRMNQYVVRSFFTSFGTSLLLITLIMVVGFMSLRYGLLALIPNVLPILSGGAIVYLLGNTFDIGVVIVASVCIGIAVDDTIHFMNHFKRGIEEGLSPEEAVKQTFRRVMPAIEIVTVILVCGFGLFAFADFMPNRNFGILTASILSFGLFTDMSMTPALLLLVTRRAPQAVTGSEAPQSAQARELKREGTTNS